MHWSSLMNFGFSWKLFYSTRYRPKVRSLEPHAGNESSGTRFCDDPAVVEDDFTTADGRLRKASDFQAGIGRILCVRELVLVANCFFVGWIHINNVYFGLHLDCAFMYIYAETTSLIH